MPLEPLGASDRIRRIRQKIVAASPLPPTASASDVIDSDAGRIWRSEDGCCGGPALPTVSFGTAPYVYFCKLYPFQQQPLPTGTIVSVHNATSDPIRWVLGDGVISTYSVAYTNDIAGGATETYTILANSTVTSMFFVQIGQSCVGVPPGGISVVGTPT